MIDYGSDDDIAKLIAHKLGANPDITHQNIKGLVMRVLSMMKHRPADVDAMVKRVSDILSSQGKMNESVVDEMSIADIEDETIHADANEQAALALREFMHKYQPINMGRASTLVHRKYDGVKSLPDIHDILLRFVNYLKMDGKFVGNPVVEAPVDTHALAASAERDEREQFLQRQRRQAEQMNNDKKIHQAASRNIRGDSITVAEASKHREIMNAHFKRARQMLYGFPTATQDDGDHDADDSSTTTVMSSGETDECMDEAEEVESTDGTDGTISQDGDELTEEPAVDATRQTLITTLPVNGEVAHVTVSYIYTPDNDDSPIDILQIKRTDNGQDVPLAQLSAVDSYNIASKCFHAYHDEPDVTEDAPMTEAGLNGAHDLKTQVSTPEEDDIEVVVNYDVEEDDDGGYAVIRSIKRVDNQQDIKDQVDKTELPELEDKCMHDYSAWAKDENDQNKIDNHIWRKSNESADLDEDMRPVDAPISDERAARKVAREIMGLPNLTYARVELMVSKMINQIGKTTDDIEKIAKLAFNELTKVGLAVKESMDEATTLDESKHKTRNATLELPVDDPDYDTDDVDVTVSYNFDKGNGTYGNNDPDGMAVDIYKVVRDDTGEDITTQITPEQQQILMQGCAEEGDSDDRDPDAMRDREMDESDDDQAYLDKRVTDYFDAAGRGLTKGTYQTWGKTFQTYTFPNDAAANAFMEENSGWGVIGVDDDGIR